MFIFAHVFAGALLGLVVWHLFNDRRAIPPCIAGAILPDLIDKPLGMLLPVFFEGGRTLFHSLIAVGIVLLCLLIFFRSRFLIPGGGMVCGILLHQIMDEMWNLPVNWFYPLFGPFQGPVIPDYIGTYFWFEITNPSEWMFMIGSVVILLMSYRDITLISGISIPNRRRTGTFLVLAGAFFCIGLYLIAAGLTGTAATFITPLYLPLPTLFAGVLALCGAVAMSRELVKPGRAVT